MKNNPKKGYLDLNPASSQSEQGRTMNIKLNNPEVKNRSKRGSVSKTSKIDQKSLPYEYYYLAYRV